jgi:hypothetical protein
MGNNDKAEESHSKNMIETNPKKQKGYRQHD